MYGSKVCCSNIKICIILEHKARGTFLTTLQITTLNNALISINLLTINTCPL